MQIRLDNFASVVADKKLTGAKYVDVSLDLQESSIRDGYGFSRNIYKDIKVSYDEDAIRNSIFNIFNTSAGDLPLTPRFGLNNQIRGYIFESVNENTARLLGDTILDGITRYEPRVRVVSVNVRPDVDESMFIVNLILEMPAVNIPRITLGGTLSQNGFRFLT